MQSATVACEDVDAIHSQMMIGTEQQAENSRGYFLVAGESTGLQRMQDTSRRHFKDAKPRILSRIGVRE